MWYLYILESLLDKTHYIGISTNVVDRLKVHNNGGSFYTKRKRPWKVIHTEKLNSLGEAREREKFLKSYKGSKEKLTIIDRCGIG